jgi:pheromone shutdown protein TraB
VPTPVEEKSVIIGERNRVAAEKIQEAINGGYKRIAVLYGGGHMPDLGRRLREELDMVPADVQWVTAWSIRSREIDSESLPLLKTLAEASGWPLNRYETLALLIFSSVLAVDLWFWELFFGTAVNCASLAGSWIGQLA